MAPANTLTDSDARFAQLLNPIRDLTKNWNIDLVGYLDLFLAELEQVSITFDDGKTSMNFAQAALLIQGSTCIYSKKVEFLYNLVMQMLDLLHSKRKAGQSSSIDDQGKDKDVTSLDKQNLEEFLSLDDIQESTNIDMKEDKNNKKKPLVVLPQTPGSLLALDECEKGDAFMYTENGDLIGNKSDFKINTSRVHASGMLVLDTTLRRLLDAAVVPPILLQGFLGTTLLPPSVPSTSTAPSDVLLPPPPADLGGDGGDDKNMDDDFVHDDPGPCDDEPMDVDEVPEAEVVPPPVTLQPEEKSYNLRCRKGKDKIENIAPVKEEDVPLNLLDPYLENAKKELPTKKGKVARVLLELLNAKETKRKRLRKDGEVLEDISVFCNKTYFSDAMKLSKNPNKTPSFPDFEARFWEECKQRKSILKKRNAENKASKAVTSAPAEDEEDDDADKDDYEPFADDGCMDVGGFDDDEDPEKRDACAAAGDKQEELAGVPATYEDLVRNHVDQYLASAQHHAQVTDLAKRVTEWEERIMPVLEQEEQRSVFDIHVYGSKVLSSFADNNRKQTLKFAEVVAGKEPFEVARYFLSTLQLANTYNVQVSTDGELDAGMDTMEVTLLSRKRHHEELNEYVAPSLNKD